MTSAAPHRMRALPQVYEYFASQRGEGRALSMTAGDMMRSVVPVYPPQGSDVIRAGSLPGEPSPTVQDEEVRACQ